MDRIDLYQLHAVDPAVPLEESVGALVELREEGKIGHIGLSNVGVEQLERARESCPSSRCRTAQPRRPESEPCSSMRARRPRLHPLGPAEGGSWRRRRRDRRVAEAHGASGQVALAWLLARSPVMIPIPGTSSVAHLEENVAAASLRLTDEEFGELSAVY